jgi:hypothetical protein
VASNLRRSRRTFSQRFLTVEQRVANLRRRPVPVRIGARVVLGDNIAPGTITPPAFSDSVATYVQETAIPGNTIYYTTTAPPGSNYTEGDLWFDSDNDYALSRWNGTAWESFGLGNAAFSTIDAGKITTGTLSAITISSNTISGNTISGNTISGNTISGNTISGNTISGGSINIGSGVFQVDSSGNLTATSATISGNITANALSAGASISTPVITGGTISGTSITTSSGNIAGWSITSTEISKGNTKLVSSGTNGSITVNLLRTSESGVRIEMGPGALGSADEIFFYDSLGNRASIRNPGSGQFIISAGAAAGGATLTVSDTGSSAAIFVGRGTNIFGARINGIVSPFANNVFSIGSGGFRWTEVFAINGVINTSDLRLKTDVEESALGLEFLTRITPVSYKWVEGTGQEIDDHGNVLSEAIPGARPHYGFIAQDVKEAFLSCGVDDFAGWTLDDKDDPNSYQGLRYSELIAPIVKAVQELNQKIELLEARVFGA